MIEQRDRLTQKIDEMQETLKRLNYKIERYEQIILDAEKRLTASEDQNE